MTLADVLTPLIRIPGVRGALLVSREDGLAVADALMEGVDGAAIAALAASLARRMDQVARALGRPEPTVLSVQGTDGMLLLAPAGGLLVVAVGGPAVNVAELRLGALRAAERSA